MKWIVTFVLLILIVPLYGQQKLGGVTDGINRVNNDLLTSWLNDIRPSGKDLSDVQGSPYFLDEWIYGKVVTVRGDRYGDMRLKLNLFQKELMVQPLSSKDSFLLDDSKLLQFSFVDQDSTYTFIRVQKLDGQKPEPYLDFYQLLASGKMNLLYQPIVEIREPPKTTMATAGGRGAGFFSQEDHFYLFNGAHIEEIKRSKKSLLRALGRHQREINSFINQKKVKLSDPNGLKQVVNYFNTLN